MVPLYTLLAAAGTTGRADLAEIAEWVTVEGHKVGRGSFVLRIQGDSMAPVLADGGLALFREPVQNPDGKIVLVEVAEDGSLPSYLVKKIAIDWRAQRETGVLAAKLVSLNDKYPPIRMELSEASGVRLVAELVAALPGSRGGPAHPEA